MKKLLLAGCLLLAFGSANAQIDDYTNAPQFAARTITGDTFDLYKTLDSGKTVIIDAMATWCPPCWSWHEDEYFKRLHEQYGPDGTDELRVVMIEADSRTPESYLYEANNNSPSSLGDWVTGVDYTIMNFDGFNDLYDVAYFPTIFAVTPNRMVYEIGRSTDLTTYAEWHRNAPGLATDDPNGIAFAYTGDDAVCLQDVNTAVRVQNHSLQPLTGMTIVVEAGGQQVASEAVAQTLAPYEIAELAGPTLPSSLLDDGTLNLTMRVVVDGDTSSDDDTVDGVVENAPTAVSFDSITVEFTTDAWPGETQLTIRDGNRRRVLRVNYEGAATGPGGPDANQTFTYRIPLEEPLECFSYTVVDSYGDGMTYFSTGDPVPGLRVIDGMDEAAYEADFSEDDDFEDSFFVAVAGELEVSGTAQPLGAGLALYPNPVGSSDWLTVDLGDLVAQEVRVSVRNGLGQTVYAYPQRMLRSGEQLTLALPHLAAGAYFLDLAGETGRSALRFTVR